MKRVVYLLALSICVCASLTAGVVIADFQQDFQAPTPAAGWSYSTGTAIGTAQPLVWNSDVNVYGYSASGGWPWIGNRYNIVDDTFVHPGPSSAQGTVPQEYVFMAYTVQAGEAGPGVLNGSIKGTNGGGSNGWDILIATNLGQIANLQFGWSANAQTFTASLGNLAVGDTVYVGIGARGDHSYDAALLDFQVSVPEPGTFVLLGAGLLAVGLLRRR